MDHTNDDSTPPDGSLGHRPNESMLRKRSAPFRLIEVRPYGLALVSIALAVGAGLFLESLHFRDAIVPLLLFAVAISSWYGRGGPAVLSVILSIVGFDWYFVEPAPTIYIHPSQIPYVLSFGLFASLISWFAASRRRSEDALRRSEAYLAEAQRLTHTGSWADDGTIRPAHWSEELYRIYGFDPRQGLPTREQPLERIHPEDMDKFLQAFNVAIHKKEDTEVDYRIVLPDGTIRYVHAIGHPVLNANGDLIEVVGTTIDITERRVADEALALRSFALNNAHDAASLIDEQGRIVYVNDEACRQTGYAREELLGMLVWNVNSDFAEERWFDHWQALKARRSLSFESRHRTKDGRIYPVEIRARYLEYEGRAFNVAIVRDITERKLAEESLRQSEAYLAEAQRLTHTGSWALDVASDEFVYVSEECARIFGFGSQEPVTRELVSRRIHPDDRNLLDEDYADVFREKKDGSHEVRVVLPDGAVRDIHTIRHPVLDSAGNVVRLVGTSMDITERKRTEDALRQSEAYLAEAQTLTHTGSWAGVSPLRPAYWSEEHYRIFGFDPQQGLPGREQPVERIHPDDRDRVIQTFERMVQQKADSETEYRIVLPDGTIRFAHGIGHPVLDAHGNVVELVGTTVDISARKRYEEERARLHQLEADLAHINRVSMMGELTASIAHEVNQPLSGVVSNGSACLRWLGGDSPNVGEASEAARRIVRDGKRAAEIIARIRALATRTGAPREMVNMNETILDVLALIRDEAKKKSVILLAKLADDLSPVLGNRVELQQVVLNLFMNGIEAMSTVTDRERELVVSSRNIDPDQVEITVQDSGTGLEPATMARIFDPFYTTKPTGMGMGLSISRSIVQSHGGRLWVTANHDPGTRFHFTLSKEPDEANAERTRV